LTAVWTRFFPIVKDLLHLIHEEKIIGDIQRTFVDFGLNMDMHNKPSTSRIKDKNLGAGALLDIGIYVLMWGNLLLDPGVPNSPLTPKITSELVLVDGIDYANSIFMSYPGKHAILTTTLYHKTPAEFCKIEGSKGTIIVSGRAAAKPTQFTIQLDGESEATTKTYEWEGMGYFWECDAVALDIKAGRVENEIMPWEETLRMMQTMDSIRNKAGLVYPQDRST
jgi:dihydrodiol dehydrogenase / D-xylose 1-dehydrogenase (NADP)